MINSETVLAVYQDWFQLAIQIEIQPQIMSNHSRNIQSLLKLDFLKLHIQKSSKEKDSDTYTHIFIPIYSKLSYM